MPLDARLSADSRIAVARFSEGPLRAKSQRVEDRGNNRSVMPFRCSGPHARYTDGDQRAMATLDSCVFSSNTASVVSNVGDLGRNRLGAILVNSVVLGIDPCNCGSSTRNSS